jgi:flagellar basal-body rod protein FlgF
VSDGIWSAVSGAVGQLAVLDTTANNVANASTPGYRGDRAVFREVLARAGTARNNAAVQRQQWKNVRYAGVDNVAIDTTQGTVLQTGRPLDAAIRGDGFFVVKAPDGERYTRVGATKVASDGTLTTKEGLPYLGTDRKPIKVGATATGAEIATDGSVRVGKETRGQMLVVRFAKPGALEKTDATMFKASAASGAAAPIAAVLEGSSLESSNVSPVKGMVDIVAATRGFDACQTAIDAFKDADRRAATLMGNG